MEQKEKGIEKKTQIVNELSAEQKKQIEQAVQTPPIYQTKKPEVPELPKSIKPDVAKLSPLDSYAGGVLNFKNPYQLPTRADIDKEKKLRRNRAIFSAIGDGISSIASIVGAHYGAAPIYNAGVSLSAKNKARYDELDRQWEQNRANWHNAQQRINNAIMARRKAIEDTETAKDKAWWDNFWKEQENQRERELINAKIGVYGAQQEKYEGDNKRADEKNNAEIARLKAATDKLYKEIQLGERKQADAERKGYIAFPIGNDETIDVPIDKVNMSTLSKLNSLMAEGYRAKGKPIKGMMGEVTGYDDSNIDEDALMMAVGNGLAHSPQAQAFLRTLATGQKQSKKDPFASSKQSSDPYNF